MATDLGEWTLWQPTAGACVGAIEGRASCLVTPDLNLIKAPVILGGLRAASETETDADEHAARDTPPNLKREGPFKKLN